MKPKNSLCAASFLARSLRRSLQRQRLPVGVLNAGLIVGLSNDAPLRIFPADFAPAPGLGIVLFIALIILLYGWMLRHTNSHGRP